MPLQNDLQTRHPRSRHSMSESDGDFDDFLERMEEINHEREARGRQLPKRYLRDFDDPLTFHSEEEFAIRYRFLKQTVILVILPLVQVQLAAMDNRGLPFQSHPH